MRIAFLFKGVQPCQVEGLRALAARGCELLIVHPATMPNTSYDEWSISDFAEEERWSDEPDAAWLQARVERFRPDVVVVVSWDWPKAYRTVMRARPAGALRVLMTSNYWRGTPRQWLGRFAHRAYLQPYYDVALVPGDRAEAFARQLGFGPDDVIRGMWAADTALYDGGPRAGTELAQRRRFVTVMRLVHHKGADVLAEAYAAYRRRTRDPWDLDVVGLGDLASSLEGLDGVTMHGFLQPPDVAALLQRSAAFVLPSRTEFFGIALHEAAAAGLPLITTDLVGAHPVFVQDSYNGWVVPSGRPAPLTEAMDRMSMLDAERLEEMSTISRSLAQRLDPQGWARNLHEEFARRLSR